MPFLRWRSRRTSTNPPPQAWAPTPPASAATEQRPHVPDAPYLLPKDTLEDQRLNFQHHLLYRTISNHYLAPIPSATPTMFDVGCGTGIWSIEMAALFPQAHILDRKSVV